MRSVWTLASGLLAAAVLLRSAPARAYDEAHVRGDDVRMRVDASGVARVEHTVSLQVLAGKKSSLDLVGVEAGAIAEPTATVAGDDGQEQPAEVGAREGQPRALRVTFGSALKRGRYRIHLAYAVDLVAAHELVGDGPMWRLTWTSPVAQEGYDNTHLVFDVPSTATEPRAVRADSDALDDTTTLSLRRGFDRDEIELARPHVSRGLASVWSLQLGPRAFPGLTLPAPAVASAPRPPVAPWPKAPLPALLALGILYATLAWAKERAFSRACLAHGTRSTLLAGLPAWLRAGLAGACLSVGLILQLGGAPTKGSLIVAAAMALAVTRVPWFPARPRGPGRWLALRPDEAFAGRTPPTGLDWLDAGTLRGKLSFVVFALLVGGVALALRTRAGAGRLAAVDVLALVPLYATGCASQLPPSSTRGARFLRGVFRALSRKRALRVAPWARVPTGAVEPDEVRILVLPRLAMPGVVGIEVGLAWWRGWSEYSSSPEVLVRVHEASAASARMTTLAPRTRPVPGRRPEERVYRLVPRLPGRGWTRALVERVAGELVDRRVPPASTWPGPERRLPPQERERKHFEAAA